MKLKESEFLKERADEFLANARYLIEKGSYTLAAFNLEQAAQLYLKYYLFLKIGDYPRTHSLSDLIEDMGEAYRKKETAKKFWEEHMVVLRNLENAYLTTRYFPVKFKKIEVEGMLKLVNKLTAFLKSL